MNFKDILINSIIILLLVPIVILSYQTIKNSAETPAGSLNSTDPVVRKLLNVPGKDASADERSKYQEAVEAAAIATDTITIKDCLPAPLIAKMREGKKFKAVNQDKEEHKLVVADQYSYELAAEKTTEITANYAPVGVFSYTCDGPLTAGIILITSDN